MWQQVTSILTAALCMGLMQECKKANEPEVNTPLEGKWMLTQISAKGEYQMIIPCYQFDSTFYVDTTTTAFEGDYMEFKPGNSYEFKITTPFDFLNYCSEFAVRETSRPYSPGRSKALGKRSTILSGEWWINGKNLFLTRAYEIGKSLDTVANSFNISGNKLTIKGPVRLDREYREQGFTILGTLEIVQSANKP